MFFVSNSVVCQLTLHCSIAVLYGTSTTSMLFCCCSSVVSEVPPPLPVKQRSKSVMTQRGSISRLYSHADDDDADHWPSTTASYRSSSTAVSHRPNTVSPLSAELTSSLDNLLAELGHDLPPPKKPPLNIVRSEISQELLPPDKPPLNVRSDLSQELPPKKPLSNVSSGVNQDFPPSKPPLNIVRSELSRGLLPSDKPPLNVRISGYDNLSGRRSEDSIDGVKCHIGPSLEHTETRPHVSTPRTCTTSSSDGSSYNSVWISDGTSERFTGSMSQMPRRVVSPLVTSPSSISSTISTTTGASPLLISPSSITSTSGVAPPLPMKLKHSKSSCVYSCFH